MKRKSLAWLGTAALAAAIGVWIGSAYAAGLPAGPKPEKKGTQFAVIGADGTVSTHSKDVFDVGNIGTGVYSVTFLGDITKCAATATLDHIDGAGEIAVRKSGVNTVLDVWTYNSSGAAENHGFHVALFC